MLDLEVWGLCLDGDGAIIRNPQEILNTWTLEDVMDAWEVKSLIAEDRRAQQKKLEAARGK
jgi:hypothetical protein